MIAKLDCTFPVPNVYDTKEVALTLYEGLTFLIGANGTGKTQTLHSLRDFLQRQRKKVRYLSSNRIGMMEQCRSQCDQYNHDRTDYSFGGQSAKRMRERIETATGDFFTMDARRDVFIKVAERLSVLFKRQVSLRWDEGNLKVFVSRTGTGKEYSVALEASGLVNVISILAAVYDPGIDYLLIDEPEVSLHPQLQAYLLREIREACDLTSKTVVLSTHSQEMVCVNHVEDICRYVFFSEGMLPLQMKPEEEVLKSSKLQEFLWRMGEVYKIGFFAKKVLLIEGVSDLILCKAISRKLSLAIDVAGCQIIPVDGKGQFPIVAKLFLALGKEVSILTDLDGFLDDAEVVNIFNTQEKAINIANAYSAKSLSEMVRGVKDALDGLMRRTYQNLASVYKSHPYYTKESETELNANSEKRMQTIKRALVAELFSQNDEDVLRWDGGKEWYTLRARIDSVLKALEKAGCYVLRKGAIESYYQFANSAAYEEKPSNAVKEVEGMTSLPNDDIETHYDVMVRALKSVAITEVVDESYAVRKELLSELALAMEVVGNKQDATESDVTAAIKQSKGLVNSLFKYEVVHENGKTGLKVLSNAMTLKIKGMPFVIYSGDNVNTKVRETVLRDE